MRVGQVRVRGMYIHTYVRRWVRVRWVCGVDMSLCV